MKTKKQAREHIFSALGDVVHQILKSVYVDNRQRFQQEAADRGITLEQLAAASIDGFMRDFFDAFNNETP